jgi:hypothetical protein
MAPSFEFIRGQDSIRESPTAMVAMISRKVPSSWCWRARIDSFWACTAVGWMKAITYLGQLEKVFGAPLAIRNWNMILGISRALRA